MNAVVESDPITPATFARLVALHCRLSGADPDEAVLEQWLAARWPEVEEDMRPTRWAEEYLGRDKRS